MFIRLYTLKRLALALTAATIASLIVVPLAAAQTASTLVVRVETPTAGHTYDGAITFTGLAVDGSTNQPATRVAVYDAEVRDANYLADVSMEMIRPLADAFPGRTGTAQIGWRLILDSTRLTDARHTLHFVAHFPSGATAAAIIDLVVNNHPTSYTRNQYGVPLNNSDMSWTPGYYPGYPYYRGTYYGSRSPYYYGGYYYNGVYNYGAPYYNGTYYNMAPYYNGAYYNPALYSPTTYPGGYYYNGIYYPAGYVNPGTGWYYYNGIWVRR